MSYTEKILRQQEKEREHGQQENLGPSGRRGTEPTPEEGEVVNAKSVVVRSSPKKNASNIIGWLSEGSTVRIRGKVLGFYKIEVDAWSGIPLYIDEHFCRVRR